MKKITVCLIALLGCAILVSNPGQVVAQADADEIQLYQTLYGMEKRNLIEEAMSLTAENSEAFWKVYEEYESKRRELGKVRIELIREYIEKFNSITPEEMDKLASGVFANNAAYDKLNSSYYEKMKGATSSATAFRWLQVEGYLHTALRSAIQDELPFMPDTKN